MVGVLGGAIVTIRMCIVDVLITYTSGAEPVKNQNLLGDQKLEKTRFEVFAILIGSLFAGK